VMSLGPEAYVLDPKSLQERVKAGLKDALEHYENAAPMFKKRDIEAELEETRSGRVG